MQGRDRSHPDGVPRSDQSLLAELVQRFADRSRDAFSAHYYAAPEEAPDTLWTLSDLESDDAPHVPVMLPYDERLATFRDLDEIAELARRIRTNVS